MDEAALTRPSNGGLEPEGPASVAVGHTPQVVIAFDRPMTVEQKAEDIAAIARVALQRIEDLSDEIEDVLAPKCREAWHTYGQALWDQRQLMPSKIEFGHWVKEQRLDTGRAASPSVRSDAMWLARQWDDLQSCKTLSGKPIGGHHPTYIRRECREAGLRFAQGPDRDDPPAARRGEPSLGLTPGCNRVRELGPLSAPKPESEGIVSEPADATVASVPGTKPWVNEATRRSHYKGYRRGEPSLFPYTEEQQQLLDSDRNGGRLLAALKRLDRLFREYPGDVATLVLPEDASAVAEQAEYVGERIAQLRKSLRRRQQ
jgi:hypothetical protein